MAHLKLQSTIDVVEHDLAIVSTLRKMITKVDLAAEGDVTTEIVPTCKSHPDSTFEGLAKKI